HSWEDHAMKPATLLPLLSALLAAPASPQQQTRRPIAETDLYRLTWIADPRISPDGTRIVYVQVTVNQKHDGYETSLWLVPASAKQTPRRLTAGPRDGSPAWSPDGHA